MGQQQCSPLPPSNYHVLLDGKSVVDQRTDGVFDRSAFDRTLLSDWVSIIDKTKILKMNLEEMRHFKEVQASHLQSNILQ